MLLTILKAPLKITALLLAFLLLLVQLACTLLLGISSFVLNLFASLFLAGAVVLMLLLSYFCSALVFFRASFSSWHLFSLLFDVSILHLALEVYTEFGTVS